MFRSSDLDFFNEAFATYKNCNFILL